MIWIGLFAFVVSMLMVALESAILSVSRARLHDTRMQKDRRRLLRLLRRPERVLAAVNVVYWACNLFVVTGAAVIAARAMGSLGYLLTAALAIPVYGAFESIPKAIGRFFPYRFLRFLWPFVFLLYYVPGTLFWIFTARPDPVQADPEWLDRERAGFKYLTEMIEEEGTLNSRAKRLIHGVLQLRSTSLRELMNPIDEVAVVMEDTPIRNALNLARKSQREAVPVRDVNGRVFGWIGVVQALKHGLERPKAGDYVSSGIFLAPSTDASQALRQLRVASSPIGFVVDEGSSVVGVVYVESILARLLGEDAEASVPA